MIDLDELLNGNPTHAQVREFFSRGEFHEERYLVQAIERHLQNEAERELIYKNRSSISDMLNGRVQGNFHRPIFERWNDLLGYRFFGRRD